ncbi:MAG: hypothetical protein WC747_02080 [Candidatus Babeliales bacterium]
MSASSQQVPKPAPKGLSWLKERSKVSKEESSKVTLVTSRIVAQPFISGRNADVSGDIVPAAGPVNKLIAVNHLDSSAVDQEVKSRRIQADLVAKYVGPQEIVPVEKDAKSILGMEASVYHALMVRRYQLVPCKIAKNLYIRAFRYVENEKFIEAKEAEAAAEAAVKNMPNVRKEEAEKESLMEAIERIISRRGCRSEEMKEYLDRENYLHQNRLELFYNGSFPKEVLEDILVNVQKIAERSEQNKKRDN